MNVSSLKNRSNTHLNLNLNLNFILVLKHISISKRLLFIIIIRETIKELRQKLEHTLQQNEELSKQLNTLKISHSTSQLSNSYNSEV